MQSKRAGSMKLSQAEIDALSRLGGCGSTSHMREWLKVVMSMSPRVYITTLFNVWLLLKLYQLLWRFYGTELKLLAMRHESDSLTPSTTLVPKNFMRNLPRGLNRHALKLLQWTYISTLDKSIN